MTPMALTAAAFIAFWLGWLVHTIARAGTARHRYRADDAFVKSINGRFGNMRK